MCEAVEKKRIYRNDFLLIGFLLVVSLLLFVIFKTKTGDTVEVSINGEVVASYSLSIDGEYVLNGGSNTIVIKNGKVHISFADCPDKLCIKQGEISKKNQSIICLPNKLTVSVKSGNENTKKSDTDFIVQVI